MARPTKQWLDYFSMDVEKDNKLKFVKAKFWLVWFATYIELLQFVYKEWYYVEFDDDNMLLFMSETWLKEEEIGLMLEFMLEKWLFIKDLYSKYKILTSSWIQKRYAEWTKKRKNTAVYKWFRVVWDYDHIELMDTLTWLKEEIIELINTESTQSKVKESKVKESKELYWSFQNVKLSLEEIEKLKKNSNREKEIEKLSMYIASTGKKYASHYATILNWRNKDNPQTQKTSSANDINEKLRIQNEETEKRYFASLQNNNGTQ